jgi:hypothetical protein
LYQKIITQEIVTIYNSKRSVGNTALNGNVALKAAVKAAVNSRAAKGNVRVINAESRLLHAMAT